MLSISGRCACCAGCRNETVERQWYHHDHVGCNEDGITHRRGNAGDHIPLPRQRVEPLMLEYSVAGHRRRGDHAHADDSLNLLALSHHRNDRYT